MEIESYLAEGWGFQSICAKRHGSGSITYTEISVPVFLSENALRNFKKNLLSGS
jgi:hypothetical protein